MIGAELSGLTAPPRPIKAPPPRLRQRWRPASQSWRLWWEPETDLRELGFAPVELDSRRLTWSTREAERLNDLVQKMRGASAEAESRAGRRTIRALIADYVTSPEFLEKAAATQRDYRQGFRAIEAKWGDSLVVDFSKRVVYQWYRSLLAEKGPYVAAALKRKFSVLMSHAVLLEWREDNPALRLKILKPPRRGRVGDWAELDMLTAAARSLGLPSMELAILLAVYQGQRRGDIIRARREAFAERSWLLRRQKRGNAGGFELHPEVRGPVEAMLATAGERERLLHYEGTPDRPYDRPYTDDLFGKVWARVRAKAAKAAPAIDDCASRKRAGDVATLQFRDLRRTFATLARAGGADTRQVADALGNKAFSDDELSQVYMPPTYESASKAVRAVSRPKNKPNT